MRKSLHQRLHTAAVLPGAPGAVSATAVARGDRVRLGVSVTAYLIAIAVAELTIVFINPVAGLIASSLILGGLLRDAGRAHRFPCPDAARGFFLSLTLVPLIRVVSLSMPLDRFAQEWWYLLISLPLFAAVIALIRATHLAPAQVGLQLPVGRHWFITAAVAGSGILLGIVEHRLLDPAPLASSFAPLGVMVFGGVLLVTGVVEEMIFRGALQSTASQLFGPWQGIAYASVVFGIMHIGHGSLADVIFVVGVGGYFGVVVQVTRSLLGVSIAHALTNIMLFIVLPLQG